MPSNSNLLSQLEHQLGVYDGKPGAAYLFGFGSHPTCEKEACSMIVAEAENSAKQSPQR